MKILNSLVAFFVFIPSTVFSQGKSSTPVPLKSRSTSATKSHWEFGLFYSDASEVNSNGTVSNETNTVLVDADFESAVSMGIDAGYVFRDFPKLGIKTGLSYEPFRKIDALELSVGNFTQRAELSADDIIGLEIVTAYIQAMVPITDEVFLVGGPLMPFISEDDISGAISFQGGIKLFIADEFNFSLLYRSLNASFSNTVGDLDFEFDGALKGVNVYLNYIL